MSEEEGLGLMYEGGNRSAVGACCACCALCAKIAAAAAAKPAQTIPCLLAPTPSPASYGMYGFTRSIVKSLSVSVV